MLVDEISIILKAGQGGSGKVSFRKKPERGPDGGDGGDGGSVYINVTKDIAFLERLLGKDLLNAEDGQDGGLNRRHGRQGKDLVITLPIGTSIIDKKNKTTIELNNLNQNFIICYGGKGGRGNFEFRSSTNQTPRYREKGKPGETKNLLLILRLIADFGLMGKPNSGKSSLLNELTAAHVKTADYPFTTLEPNLGAMGGKILADIPGLISGASQGKGLGIKFLKHIEKVHLLLHCISCESENILNDYQIVVNELKKFNPQLIKKKEVILLTKSDLVSDKTLKKQTEALKKLKKKILPVSIYNWEQVEKLRSVLLTS